MILQKQPNGWSCAPTAWAMAFNVPVTTIIQALGHDGGLIQWPDKPEPKCRKGFHFQEFVRIALTHCNAVTPVELFPVLDDVALIFDDNWNFFNNIIQTSRGVIEGQGHFCKHAVAYEYGLIYDPAGEIYPYSREACEQRDFYSQCAWRLTDAV